MNKFLKIEKQNKFIFDEVRNKLRKKKLLG